MTLQATSQKHDYVFLRRVLQANGIFSALSGALFIFGAGPVASFLGLTAPWILAITGVILIVFAADLFYLAAQRILNHSAVYGIIAADVAWVVGSGLLLLTDWVSFTAGGFWAVAIVADIVTVFAVLQWYGLRRK